MLRCSKYESPEKSTFPVKDSRNLLHYEVVTVKFLHILLAPEKMTERFTSANRKIYLFIPFNRKSVWHSIPSSKFSHTLRSENLREMLNVSTSRAYIHLYYQEFSGSLYPSFAATRSKRGYSGTAKNATFLGKSHLVQLFFLPR